MYTGGYVILRDEYADLVKDTLLNSEVTTRVIPGSYFYAFQLYNSNKLLMLQIYTAPYEKSYLKYMASSNAIAYTDDVYLISMYLVTQEITIEFSKDDTVKVRIS